MNYKTLHNHKRSGGLGEGQSVTGMKELVRMTNGYQITHVPEIPKEQKAGNGGLLSTFFCACTLLPYRGSVWPQSRAAIKTDHGFGLAEDLKSGFAVSRLCDFEEVAYPL